MELLDQRKGMHLSPFVDFVKMDYKVHIINSLGVPFHENCIHFWKK